MSLSLKLAHSDFHCDFFGGGVPRPTGKASRGSSLLRQQMLAEWALEARHGAEGTFINVSTLAVHRGIFNLSKGHIPFREGVHISGTS